MSLIHRLTQRSKIPIGQISKERLEQLKTQLAEPMSIQKPEVIDVAQSSDEDDFDLTNL